MKFTQTLVTAVFCAALSAASAFGGALDKDTLIVGTNATYPPYEFRAKDGSLQGYDVDLIEAIGKKLGKKIQWQDTAFDGLLPAVLMGKIDIIASGMSATPKRREKVAFSGPTNKSAHVIFVKTGSPLNSEASFKGKVLGVQMGTIQEAYAMAHMPETTTKPYKSSADCFFDVVYGRLDGTLISASAGYSYATSKDFKGKVAVACIVEEMTKNSNPTAFAMNKKDSELLAAVDKCLDELKASGEFQALRDKWGLDDWKQLLIPFKQ